MVDVFRNENNGVSYKHFRNEKDAVGVCCIGDKRFIIHGRPKISITQGSWKYGKEMQFSLISHKNLTVSESRNNSLWNVVEINMPYKEGKELIKALYKEVMKDSVPEKAVQNDFPQFTFIDKVLEEIEDG